MKRVTGAIFVLIAAILYCCPYICSAIYLQNSATLSDDMFAQGLDWVSGHFLIFSVLAVIIGAIYLIWAEVEDYKKS